MVNTIRRVTPYFTLAPRGGRPINGVCVHHTATTLAVLPHAGGSWHYAIGRQGEVYLDVPEEHIAWGAARTDRWRPPWVVRSAVLGVSDINWCAIHIELVYAPQAPHNQVPTPTQEASLRALLADIYARRGRLAIVGHGDIQADKWITEPHALDWRAVDCGEKTVNGRYYTPLPQEEDVTEAERLILDAASRQGLDAAGIDQMVGINRTLGEQVNGLQYVLRISQEETAAARQALAECQARPATPEPEVESVAVRFRGGREVVR